MKLFFFSLISVSMLWFMTSCTAQEEAKPTIKSVVYEPCCGLDTIVYQVGKEWVAIPNVFTPNGDGINDWFYPIRSNDSISIYLFAIYDTIYDHGSKVLIFDRQDLNYSYLDMDAWKGTKRVGLERSTHKGIFKYKFIAIYKNDHAYCEGTACSIVCDDEAPIFQDKSNCFFMTQFNANGVPTKALPSGEEKGDCLGY